MGRKSGSLQQLARYPGTAVAFSIVACYGTLAVITLLSLVGITMNIHAGAWATVTVVFAWLAVFAVGVNMQHYRRFGPFILSDIGALLVSWVMFVDYSRTLEIAGFALLIAAVLLDRRLRMRNRPQLREPEQETD
jgi:hypothetical protein